MTTYKLPKRENALAELKRTALSEGLVTMAARIKDDPTVTLASYTTIQFSRKHTTVDSLILAAKDYATEALFDGEGYDSQLVVKVFDANIEFDEVVAAIEDPDGWGGPTRLIVIEHRLDAEEVLVTERQVSYWSETTTEDDDGNKTLSGVRPYYNQRIADAEVAAVRIAVQNAFLRFAEAANCPTVSDERTTPDAYEAKLERTLERVGKEWGLPPEDVRVLSDG